MIGRLTAGIPPLAIIALMLLPLAGLTYGLINPPPALFMTTPPSLAEVVTSSGAVALLLRSLALGGVVAVASLGLGTILAWLEQRCCYRGQRVLAIGALLPLAMPSYLIAAVLRHEFSAGGLVGGPLGINSFSGWGAATVVLTIISTPLVQLVVGAALSRSSAAEEEAARSLGAGPARIFRTVWFPRLRPAWAVGLVLVALYVISDFGAVSVLDCQVLTWRMYQAAEHQRTLEVVVLSGAVLLTTVPLVVGASYLRGRQPRSVTVANPRPAPRHPLSKGWIAVAYLLHIPFIAFGMLLPVITCVRWMMSGELDTGIGTAIHDSVWLMVVGTVVVIVLGLVTAWPSARSRNRTYGHSIEHGIYFTGALPGVLLGAGLVLAALGLARSAVGDPLATSLQAIGLADQGLYAWLKVSGILLMVGYAARFLPEAFAPLKAAVLHIDQRQIDCARTLGVSRWRRWTTLMVPALAPGCAAASVLVGIAILKELPITLLLGGTRRPLSYRVWERYEEGFLPDAGAAGLLLTALALVAVVVSLRFRRHV